MKTHRCLVLALTTLALTPALGQQPPAAPPPRQLRAPAAPPVAVTAIDPTTGLPVPGTPSLTKFNLDFSGGTPKELVAAIQKAMGKPLNAIISDEHSNVELPPLKMNNVDIAQLFQALQAASRKTEAFITGSYAYYGGPQQQYQASTTSYGFQTEGKPTDDSIWYFVVNKPALPPMSPPQPPAKACHFYPLAPYLERGLTVDDITTAIETGWKMLGDASKPTISFHKDTKLLIAVGEPSKLETIDAVLKALEPPAKPLLPGVVPKQEPTAKPAEKPKDNE